MLFLGWECYRATDLTSRSRRLSYQSISYLVFSEAHKQVISAGQPCVDQLYDWDTIVNQGQGGKLKVAVNAVEPKVEVCQ